MSRVLKLQEMEYIVAHHGGRGQSFVYELLFNGEDDDKPQMSGLLDITTVQTSSIPKAGSSRKQSSSSTQRASNEHGSSIGLNEVATSVTGASGLNGHKKHENAPAAQELTTVVS